VKKDWGMRTSDQERNTKEDPRETERQHQKIGRLRINYHRRKRWRKRAITLFYRNAIAIAPQS